MVAEPGFYQQNSGKVVSVPTNSRKDVDVNQLAQLLEGLDLTPLERERAEAIVATDCADVAQALLQLLELTIDVGAQASNSRDGRKSSCTCLSDDPKDGLDQSLDAAWIQDRYLDFCAHDIEVASPELAPPATDAREQQPGTGRPCPLTALRCRLLRWHASLRPGGDVSFRPTEKRFRQHRAASSCRSDRCDRS